MLTINKEMKKKGFTRTLTSKRKLVCGFTIVEVLVVIGIIAILTVIIFPSINNIKKKNRDAEKISDIASLQLGLSLYYNQHPNEGYPKLLLSEEEEDEKDFRKYVTADTLHDPDGVLYTYVPLTKDTDSTDPKCTYYHLGTVLDLPSAQIDVSDTFSSMADKISNNYSYCGDYSGPGLEPPKPSVNLYNYNVRP